MPIKIAIVCPREPWYHGGQERVVANTAKYLKNQFDIEIYCTGEKNYEKVWNNIPVHVFKGFTKDYRYSPGLKKEITLSDFDIIHAHGFTVHSSYIASKKKDSKLFVLNPHFHEVGSTYYNRLLRGVYDPVIGKKIMMKADRIITVSNIEKNWLLKKFDIKNKIMVIPNGVNIDKISNAKPYDFDGRLILYVGRLEKYKNVHTLIRSMKYLPKNYFLYIIGKGSYKNTLLNLIKQLNLIKKVKILSDITDEEKYRWLKTCNIFINLSDIEAFGITIIEALSAGKPSVVKNKGGLAELAELHSDCIFKINLDESTLKELANLIMEKSISRVKADLNEYRWENICEKIKCVYDELLI